MAIFGGPIQTSGHQAPDYSPVIDANRLGGMLQQQLTQGALGQVTDYFKQQGETKKLLKQSDVQIDAALKLFPDLAPTLQGVRDQIRNENLPLNDRAAIAESVAGLINMGTNQMRFQAEQNLQREQIDASNAPSPVPPLPKPTTFRPGTVDINGQPLYVKIGSDGYYYDPKSETRIVDLDAYARGEASEVYGGGAGMGDAQFLTDADMMLPQDGGAALMDGGVLPPPPVDLQQAAGIQSALGYSPQLAGGLPPGVEGPVIPDLTSPSASPEQIQAALDTIPPQAMAPAPARPQAQGQLQPRLIGQPKKEVETETRGLTEEEVKNANLPSGNYVGRFVDGKLVGVDRLGTDGPSAIKERTQAFAEARRLYRSGKEDEALDLLNGVRASGLFGSTVTAADLPGLFNEDTEAQPAPTQKQDSRPPLGELLSPR